jgi:hypothetical protein
MLREASSIAVKAIPQGLAQISRRHWASLAKNLSGDLSGDALMKSLKLLTHEGRFQAVSIDSRLMANHRRLEEKIQHE